MEYPSRGQWGDLFINMCINQIVCTLILYRIMSFGIYITQLSRVINVNFISNYIIFVRLVFSRYLTTYDRVKRKGCILMSKPSILNKAPPLPG